MKKMISEISLEKSKLLLERAKKVSPGGVHSPVRAFKGVGGPPVFVESAKGVEMIDVDGNRYIDFCMSWGPLIFGHQDPEVFEAVSKAMKRGWSFGTAEGVSLELAELMTEKLPGIDHVRFVSSGTEAVMSALRLARGITGRSKILKFDGCYHGHVDSMLVRAGSGLAEMASPDSAGVSQATASETLVAPLNDLTAIETIFAEHGSEIAAIIIEPLPANNGLMIQEQEFLKGLRTIADKNGALLIFDEVISGFRVAFGGMAEITGITPDLVTYGKVIGGGFPVGAYAGKASHMNQIAPNGPVYQAGTLSANPVAMTAGLTMLQKLQRDQPFNGLSEKAALLRAAGLKFSEKYPELCLQTEQFGSLFWTAFGAQGRTPIRTIEQIPSHQKERFAEYFHLMLNQGFYLAPSGYEVGFLSTAHTNEHLEGFIEASDRSFQRLLSN
jgi:glutamate-1-semialdehyde 2,1-aminomutase